MARDLPQELLRAIFLFASERGLGETEAASVSWERLAEVHDARFDVVADQDTQICAGRDLRVPLAR